MADYSITSSGGAVAGGAVAFVKSATFLTYAAPLGVVVGGYSPAGAVAVGTASGNIGKITGIGYGAATGSGRLKALSGSGVGYVIALGTGAADLRKVHQLVGYGNSGCIGTGSGAFAGLTGEGTGVVLAVGTASATLKGVIGAGIGTGVYKAVVVNAQNGVVTEWAPYGFNSFCFYRGSYYGASSAGVMKLFTGDLDNTSIIEAEAHLPTTDFNSNAQKFVTQAYLNARGDGELEIDLYTDEEEDPYEYFTDEDLTDSLSNHRVPFGRGCEGENWKPVIKNVDGSDFALRNLDLHFNVSSRRIRSM
jgi:hypothetical protein